jgi:hypothetical protein
MACFRTCSCTIESLDTDCINTTVSGSGSSTDPYTISSELVLDPDGGLTCGPSGLAATSELSTIPYGAQILVPKSGFYQSLSSLTTFNLAVNESLRCYPLYIPRPVTLSRIGLEVVTAGQAGSRIRLGIYNDDGSFYPGSLLLDAGTIDGASTTVQEIIISQAVGQGTIWLAFCAQIAPATAPGTRNVQQMDWAPADDTAPTAAQLLFSYSQEGVSGAFPANFVTTPNVANSFARMFVKVL